MPFNVPVAVGQIVKIGWDNDVSRYVVTVEQKTAA